MNNQTHSQEGSVLIIVAVSLPIILGLLALALNVGTLHYVQSAYTSIATTATASALNPVGDEMVDIIDNKIHDTPPYIPVSSDPWDNLTDDERIFLTTNSTLKHKVENLTKEYLQKNIAAEGMMRKDFIIKDIKVKYPYEYHLSDNSVKVYLEFRIEAPIHFIESMSKKDILIKSESQLRIK
jgi:hypothetical protein